MSELHLTGKFRLGNNLAQKLCEVRQVLAEEVGLNNDSLTCVVGRQFATKEFGLAGDT